MKSDKIRNSELMRKASSSKNLLSRAAINQRYAENDFNLWIRGLLDELSFSSVLDVCCGTGNQLVLYAGRSDVDRIVGVDISQQSLDKARDRLQDQIRSGHVTLKAARMEEMFCDQDLAKEHFDLISCFYGLYYSQNPDKTLHEIIDHLKADGSILIAGPHGENNADFFKLLQRHFSLPDLVIRSSTTFMEHEVYPLLFRHCEVRRKDFVNRVHYPNPQSLIDYWRASTFYFSEYEDAVVRDVEAHFSAHREFIVEKHVMAYIARKVL